MTKAEHRIIEARLLEEINKTATPDPTKVTDTLRALRETEPQSWWSKSGPTIIPIFVTAIATGLTIYFQETGKLRDAELKRLEGKNQTDLALRQQELAERQYKNEERKRASAFIELHRKELWNGTDEQFQFALAQFCAVIDESVQGEILARLKFAPRSTEQNVRLNQAATLVGADAGKNLAGGPKVAMASDSGPITAVPAGSKGTIYCQASTSVPQQIRSALTDGLRLDGFNVPGWQVSDKLSMPARIEVRYYRGSDSAIAKAARQVVVSGLAKQGYTVDVKLSLITWATTSSKIVELWIPKV